MRKTRRVARDTVHRACCLTIQSSRRGFATRLISGVRLMRNFLMFLGVALTGIASACILPPQDILRDHNELVAEATSIVLVKTVPESATGCSLQILQVLKGHPGKLPIACHLATLGDWMTDFKGHTAKMFWEQRAGRLRVSPSCSVTPPAFEIGHTYVLLLGVHPDTKQFEEVTSNDRWLTFIKSHVSGQ